jgi:hypothetical protein
MTTAMSEAGGSADVASGAPARRPHLLRRVPWWEWVLLLSFALVWLAVAGPRAIAQTGCRIEPFPLVFGADMGVAMTVKAGSPCAVAARTASGVISHFEIEARPSHGQVQRRGRTGAVYRSDPQYRGEDSFGFALSGSSPGSSGTAIIRVKVTVR